MVVSNSTGNKTTCKQGYIIMKINPDYMSTLFVNNQVQQMQGAQQAANVNYKQGQHQIEQANEAAMMMMKK